MEISRSNLNATSNHLNVSKKNLFILLVFLGSDWKYFQETKQMWCVFPELSPTFTRQKGKEQHLYFLYIMLLRGSHSIKKKQTFLVWRGRTSLKFSADFISTVQQVTATAFHMRQIKYWSGDLGLESIYLFFYSTEVKCARKSLFSQSVWSSTCNLIRRRKNLLLYFRHLFLALKKMPFILRQIRGHI